MQNKSKLHEKSKSNISTDKVQLVRELCSSVYIKLAAQETRVNACRNPSFVTSFHSQSHRAQVFYLTQLCCTHLQNITWQQAILPDLVHTF